MKSRKNSFQERKKEDDPLPRLNRKQGYEKGGALACPSVPGNTASEGSTFKRWQRQVNQ
jgi:hypothetical protein